MLREILIYVQDSWEEQEETFQKQMLLSGVFCKRAKNIPTAEQMKKIDFKTTLLLTDDKKMAAEWKKYGGICVGCMQTEGFFDGADLVTDRIDLLDRTTLEETLLRGVGLPVTIAETERLRIREIAEADIEMLYQMSQQKGMEHLFQQQQGENCFLPEHMRSYIETAYRFYGYGLWSVWTKTGKLIGCCGFSDFKYPMDKGTGQICQEEDLLRLELQYMLTPEMWKQGYGQEMCKAALCYISERTSCREVWVRISKENTASLKLAQKLGFIRSDIFDEKVDFLRRMQL